MKINQHLPPWRTSLIGMAQRKQDPIYLSIKSSILRLVGVNALLFFGIRLSMVAKWIRHSRWMGRCDGKVPTTSLYKGISKMYSSFLDSELIPTRHCSDMCQFLHTNSNATLDPKPQRKALSSQENSESLTI